MRGEPAGTDPGSEVGGAVLIQQAADQVERLLVASSANGTIARERSEELVRVLVDLYGAGLARLLDLLFETGRLDGALLDELVADELLSGLLLVHGLHPLDTETRVARALDSVRPYLGSHGGDVELVEITEAGVVKLRLTGSCDGCPSSAVTLELAVEGAVRDAAPETTGIEVQAAAKPAAVIALGDLRRRTSTLDPPAGGGWQRLAEAPVPGSGRAEAHEVAGVAVVVCAVGNDLFAFRDRCPGCTGSLAGAALHRRLGSAIGAAVLRCPGCSAHFDVRGAGAGIDSDLRLEPLPLLIRDGGVEIAVAVTA